ncbi:MAG: aminotransferase class V-fold PLP-dependent enzyme [Candidatus Promineifilaceae bacterium]|nr:aminotransferase class V-fold PLP-dependent enzyme [Candidatus Promineifilaceae bacterium]
MIERIRELERAARALEPDAAIREAWLGEVSAYARAFLDALPEAPAYMATAGKGEGLLTSPLAEEGIPLEQALALLGQYVDRPGVNPASGRFLGYIPGGGLFPSALGDFLAAIANRYSGIFFASPGAVRMENMLLDWMAEVVGYPAGYGGTLTSGGSIANLVGIVTARDVHEIEGERIGCAVVYLSEHTHHSVDKALRIAGLGGVIQRRVPVDERYRMDAAALADLIAHDREAGLEPWLVVASAGSTNTGSVDPLEAIATIAHDNGLWLHIDGAYGGFFILCDSGREILHGMERSDSLVMDPHKSLFLPYGTGAVLVREGEQVLETHHYLADYMQDTVQAMEEPSPADFSPELTRHFRGLRLWLPLKLFGVAPFRAALEEKILLTRYFHRRLAELPGFEVGPEPDLSVFVYRYLPRHGDPDRFNRLLIERLQQEGRIFVSSTQVADQFVLRAAVLSFRTHLDDVEEALERLVAAAGQLEETR